jgi:hypothetical protein
MIYVQIILIKKVKNQSIGRRKVNPHPNLLPGRGKEENASGIIGQAIKKDEVCPKHMMSSSLEEG